MCASLNNKKKNLRKFFSISSCYPTYCIFISFPLGLSSEEMSVIVDTQVIGNAATFVLIISRLFCSLSLAKLVFIS